MDINELWQKMQGEFNKQNSRLDRIEEQVAKIPEIEKQVAKIPEIEKQVAKIPEIEKQVAKIPEIEKQVTKIPGIEKEVKTLNEKIDTLNNKVSRLEETTERIDKKLDDTININIARILNEQTSMRFEMNAKLNMIMLKHEKDYRKLAYQIAKFAEDAGMNYEV